MANETLIHDDHKNKIKRLCATGGNNILIYKKLPYIPSFGPSK